MHPRTLKILRTVGVNDREIEAASRPRIHNYKPSSGGYGLKGGTGVGKTWRLVEGLARAIDRIVLESRTPETANIPYNYAKWVNWPDTAEVLKSWVSRGFHDDIAEAVECLNTTQLLFLDDLGQERVTGESDYSLGILREIIDTRYRSNRIVFWTTNLSSTDLTKLYGARTISRMMQAWPIVEIDGPDLRLKGVCR